MNKLLTAIMALVIFEGMINAQIDSTTVVYSWKLDRNYDGMERVVVDTNLIGFQKNDPAVRQFISATTLGNFSLATISNLFTERDRDQEFILINTYYPYMKHFWNTAYINTRKPFSYLSYTNGGSSLNKEEMLQAFHSQNISQVLNAGFHLSTARALGQYRFQRTTNNSFRLFSSYSGERYSYHMNVNIGKVVADENGGITSDSFVTDSLYADTKDIPTLFGGIDNPPKHQPDVYREIKNINAFAIHELSLRSVENGPDSLGRQHRLLDPRLAYIFSFDRTINLYHDRDPSVGYEAGLYDNIFINEDNTADSLYYWKVQNTIRLKFQGKQTNRYFVDYGFDMMQFTMSTSSGNPAGDTLLDHWFISQDVKFPGIRYNNKLFNSHVSSGFSRSFTDWLAMDLYGRFYVSGYRQGDLYLSGNLKFRLNPSTASDQLEISAVNELKTPDFILSHYASNHFIWTRNFKRTAWNNLSLNLNISSKKFEFKGDYYLIRDFVFFNMDAQPEQYHQTLSVLVLELTKRFDFWKITSENKLAYQAASNNLVLSLPAFIWNSSTYLTHLIQFRVTGGRLLTMIGFDLKYNTKYYANAYMPPLAAFYQQRERKLGNYPYVDVFLNVQLKRFRFSLSYAHVNSGLTGNEYFTALHYPMNKRYLKFGISWTFYD